LNKEYLLVDGYNIIHAWQELKELAEENLEQARDKLLQIMCNYQGFKEIEVIVVFDAHKVKGNVGKIIRYHNIDVVYTKEAETADEYIERVTHQIGRVNRVRVATSDGLEQVIILGRGATRLSARELHREVEKMKKVIDHQYIEKNEVQRNTVEGFMDSKLIEWMEQMRRKR
jgi:predicted RNA-binding protein with PIN domain